MLQMLSGKKSVATVALFKKNYWLFHKSQAEQPSEEKQNPADKAWLIVKYMNSHPIIQSKGYRLRIGDTIKFGRVRFKVI